MDPAPSDAPDANQVLFRRGKKRKTYRQRGDDGDAGDAAGLAMPSTTAAGEEQQGGAGPIEPRSGAVSDEPGRDATIKNTGDGSLLQSRKAHDGEEKEEEEGGLSVAEVLRLRNARKSKLRGVELRADAAPRDDDRAALVDAEDDPDEAEQLRAEAIVGGVTKRFAPQIGLVGELVNRHMEEYIESALAKRQPGLSADAAAAAATATAFANFTAAAKQQPRQPQQREPQDEQMQDADLLDGKIAPGTDGKVLRGEGAQVPALRGKLHEVDLGTESRAVNIARTERVRRILRGEAPVWDEDQEASSQGNEGGKPSSSRARRNSEDALRDQMVEEFLNENTLDVYDKDDADALAGDQSLPADERVAEQFRREFMMAMSQSRRRRRAQRPVNAHFAKGQKRPGAKKDHEILRGPKLGGSRNERAAMRDILLKQAQEEKAAAARR